MTTTYTARDLKDIADQFDQLASTDRRRAATASFTRDRQRYVESARIWTEAADILRNTTLAA